MRLDSVLRRRTLPLLAVCGAALSSSGVAGFVAPEIGGRAPSGAERSRRSTARDPRPRPRASTTTFLRAGESPLDKETPEEREARMELVRRLQRTYYGDGGDASTETDASTLSSSVDVDDATDVHGDRFEADVFVDLPLWRVPWSELPGFQNCLNVHEAHYTHMFRTLLNGPKPWYFGHLYLEGGSANKDAPEYQLPDDRETRSEFVTNSSLTGVLMRISDYETQTDGRLTIAVQALERFEVLETSSVRRPYSAATVRLLPDEEALVRHSADGVAAAAEALHWHSFEFRRVELSSDGMVSPLANYDASATTTTKKDELTVRERIREAQHRSRRTRLVEDDEPSSSSSSSVSPFVSLGQLEDQVWIALDEMLRLLQQADEKGNVGRAGSLPMPSQLVGLLPARATGGTTLTVDAAAGTAIVTDDDNDDDDNDDGGKSGKNGWPESFFLDDYVCFFAQGAEERGEVATVGTYTKSPFVHVGALTSSARDDHACGVDGEETEERYPYLRRAQRFSYAVWVLLGSIRIVDPKVRRGDEGNERQAVLEMTSVAERLLAAKTKLDGINRVLRGMVDDPPFG